MHTARSRNDQVATDFRLWMRDEIDHLDKALLDFQHALAAKALAHAATVMPGLTHMQTAQPVTFGHHLLAYVEMAARDRGRFADARKRLNESPLGAAALAGTSFPLDRAMTAKALRFDRPAANSLDAVSDRDFVMETLAAASIAAVHLSRLAEEIVIWTSPLANLAKLSDKFTTGSSIMPQKRNPDAAELVRAKTGRVIGALTALLVVMKGLPLAYAKDMQEDKEGAMDALAALSLSIAAMAGMVADLEPDTARMKKAAGEGYATATDLADWLVRTLKLPFRDAHRLTGRIVAKAAEAGLPLHRLPLGVMQEIEPRISDDVFNVLSVARSVQSRTTFGGTAPKNVRAQAKKWLRSWLRRNPDLMRPGLASMVRFAMLRSIQGARHVSRFAVRPLVSPGPDRRVCRRLALAGLRPQRPARSAARRLDRGRGAAKHAGPDEQDRQRARARAKSSRAQGAG